MSTTETTTKTATTKSAGLRYGHNRVASWEKELLRKEKQTPNGYAVNTVNPAIYDGDNDSGMGDVAVTTTSTTKQLPSASSSRKGSRVGAARSESVQSNVSISRQKLIDIDAPDVVHAQSGSDNLAALTAATTAANSTFSLGLPRTADEPDDAHHHFNELAQQTNKSLHVHRQSVTSRNFIDENAIAAALMAKHPATGDEHWSQTSSLTCTQANGAVKLRLSPETADIEPRTVYGMLKTQATQAGSELAMRVKRDGKWVEWTYRDYYEDVMRAAKSLVKLGLQPGHGVGILGFNAPEWFISDLGAIVAGGLAVGIYTTNSAEACQYVAENSRCDVILVEDDKYLDRILQVRSQLPDLKAIVQYTGKINPKFADDAGIMTWEQFMALSEDDSAPSSGRASDEEDGAEPADGVSAGDAALQQRIDALAPNKCCTIIYTSGTTGNPKGAMLSHDNLLFVATTAQRAAQLKPDSSEVYISYLPLSHVAAQITDVYLPLVTAGCVNFAQPDALKGSLGDTLRECRPTAILGVPRVWEKIQEKMQSAGRSSGFLKRHLAAWAKSVGLRGNRALLDGEPSRIPWGWSLAKMFVFKKVRSVLGLDRCRLCATGAAPVMLETLEYFLSLDIPIYEIYGMSESTGPHTVSLPQAHRLMSVGRTLPGCRTRIDKPDKDGNGEVCMYGRNVFMGYLGMQDKTDEDVDADGWLHSGDIGRLDADGYLYITGRLKELIITAGGENVAPVPIEDMLKENCPLISNAMLIGDKRKFLSVLVTLKCETDRDSGAPTDKLLPLVRDYLKEHAHIELDSVTAACENKAVRDLINKAVEQTNKKAVSRAARIAKFEILPQDFSVPGGELGPTMKLRRPVVMKMYHDLVENVYAGGGGE